jgi:(E)-4-hydroxy-3-methylbut-2-enyl-diphosphate synthase
MEKDEAIVVRSRGLHASSRKAANLMDAPETKITRRKTRQVRIGKLLIGGEAPISIQSMTNVDTEDVDAVLRQIDGLVEEGCEIVRLAVPTRGAAKALREIRRRTEAPLVADIHFNYRLALESIAGGVDKIRINPGFLREESQIRAVILEAKAAGVPIRVGANSGSILRHDPKEKRRDSGIAGAMVEKVGEYLRFFAEEDFHEVVISLKASSVLETVKAYEMMSQRWDYPLHLGITACGPPSVGIVKSAIGLGHLLIEGIGDTVRVSLTGDPREEVKAAKRILQGLELRRFGPSILSCPTCGRCKGDLISLVEEIEEKLGGFDMPIRVAVMGCEVNGPGEAAEADVGVALGKRCGFLFKQGEVVRKVPFEEIVAALLSEIEILRKP